MLIFAFFFSYNGNLFHPPFFAYQRDFHFRMNLEYKFCCNYIHKSTVYGNERIFVQLITDKAQTETIKDEKEQTEIAIQQRILSVSCVCVCASMS